MYNCDDAVTVARDLAKKGDTSIKWCGGIGHADTARIASVVEGQASVGVDRFDTHPGLDGTSGGRRLFTNQQGALR